MKRAPGARGQLLCLFTASNSQRMSRLVPGLCPATASSNASNADASDGRPGRGHFRASTTETHLVDPPARHDLEGRLILMDIRFIARVLADNTRHGESGCQTILE